MGELTVNTAGCIAPEFNPTYYYGDILSLITNPQSSTSTLNVTSTQYYTVTTATGAYASTTGQAPASVLGTGACTNVIKEAIYTFKYTAREDGFLTPNSVDVILVLYDSITGTADQTVSVPMKFKTFFELSTATEEIYYRSGNSGYLDLEPVLVGSVDAGTNSTLVNKDGFMSPISSST
mmetsp:Transcript_17986/g.15909  ORF Transcript_17986/g.15909 Transcript_17986/m.15909 type:complete len:179 (-) Transcript_17986:654-1190(-)